MITLTGIAKDRKKELEVRLENRKDGLYIAIMIEEKNVIVSNVEQNLDVEIPEIVGVIRKLADMIEDDINIYNYFNKKPASSETSAECLVEKNEKI